MPGLHIPGVGLHLIYSSLGPGLCFRESKIAVRDFLFFSLPPHYAQQLLVKIRNCPTALRSTVMPGRVI